MIQMETVIKSADNSGAKFIKCIKVLGGLKRRTATLGDRILVSIRYLKNNKKLNKRDVYSAVVVGTTKPRRRIDGTQVKFDRNRAVLLNDQFKFLGTRIYGVVAKEAKQTSYTDFVPSLKGTI